MRFEGLTKNEDFLKREFDNRYFSICLYYLSTVCNEDDIFDKLISPFYLSSSSDDYVKYLRSFPNCSLHTGDDEGTERLLDGFVMVALNGSMLSVRMKDFKSRSVSESTEENVLQGPKDGLNEDIHTSMNLIRNRYKSESLRMESHSAGSKSKIKLMLLFDEQLADAHALSELKEKLSHIHVDLIQSAGQLQKNLIKSRFNLFPLFLTTERPDRVVKNLAEGKIVILIEGSSWALIGPAAFFDFFKSMDDPVQMPVIGQFMLFIRYVALVITLVLPALYIAIISYSPDLLKVQFALLVAGSRMSVPFPSYVEIMFMLIMTEFLIEASIRLPKTISPTATTVGGLILGQAATEAGLVAEVMIIVISAVAISNFVIPVNSMHQAIRVIRYPLIILASFLGTIGVVLGLLALIAYLCNLRSLGKPYMKLL
ncbi:spore germination protein [Paenibacillus glycanilyticus]|uniref:spore germination protein n=1 Tax=Paenibacillus glycanilyticus TaxID=126569 RepID=UPI002041DDF8|nr:spore germination protein [Paenibacillus glycanilyticus]MCM3628373.1 spore germination protein [Paenibacillus glycanilyticus]